MCRSNSEDLLLEQNSSPARIVFKCWRISSVEGVVNGSAVLSSSRKGCKVAMARPDAPLYQTEYNPRVNTEPTSGALPNACEIAEPGSG
jgi:hypothetical protein